MSVLRALMGSVRRATSSWVIAGVALGALAAAPATAAPVQGFGPVGSFGSGGSGPGGLTAPQHVAVDDATGNVLVADQGNGRVEVFQPDGAGSATYLTEFGSAAVSQPYGVAVDQSTGDVYVSGNDGVAPKIARFVSDGLPTPTYTLDGTFTSPTAGAGAGQIGDFNSPIAVDPATHELIVADRGNKRIDRFSSAGVFVRASDATGVPGGFTSLTDVTATASDVYVTDAQSDNSFGTGRSRILQFAASGAYEASIGNADTPAVAAVDGLTGNVVAVGNTRIDQSPKLNVYRGGALRASTDFASAAAGSIATGIAVGGGANRHVYVVTDLYPIFSTGVISVQVFDPSPAVEADEVTSPDSRSVDLTGIVNPEGNQTSAHFEYFDGTSWTPTTPDSVLNGTTDQTITAHVTGLQPATNYQFRVVATDTRTTAVSTPATARTAGEAPTVVTGTNSESTTTAASVEGAVTPLGLQSTYYFEYGTTDSYGSRSPAGAPGVVGNGYAAKAVSARLTNLNPGTTYHYRLVALNAAGTNHGADRTFNTASSDLHRAYEMVSPTQKTAVPVDAYFSGFKSDADGNSIVYTTQKATYDDEMAGPYVPRVLGTRSATGWASRSLDPPLTTSMVGQDSFYGVIAVSDDLDRALVMTTRKLGAEGVDGAGNLYIHDLKADSYELVASSPDPNFYADMVGTGAPQHYVGGSSDLTTVAIYVDVALRPGDPVGGNRNIYSWSKATGLQLASVMPNGTPAVNVGNIDATRDANRVSSDGSRVFFQVNGSGVFVRQNGTTVAVSATQRTGDTPAPNDSRFLGASPDGRYVMFSNEDATPLTDDAPAASENAYRYDVDTRRLSYVAPNVYSNNAHLARPASGDLYYLTLGSDLYYEHNGSSTLIASGASTSTYMASPDGRYFAFQASGQLTPYDNGGRKEVYLYDAASGSLTCPSCRTDNGAASGDAQLGQDPTLQLGGYVPRALRDDGTLYFDTPDPLVPSDTNGQRDVYEYNAASLRLISPGTGKADATFVDATPDGSNVFFVTDEKLVAQDQDATPDLYDARVGGGIAAQNPDPGPAPCGGSECREPGAGPTTSDAAPTMTSAARPVKPSAATKPKLTLVHSTVGKTSIKITVTTSSRGRIRASGAAVRATSHNATKAATYTLTVPLTQKTRTARRKGHRVKIAVRVALTAPFASPVSIKLTRTVGK